MLTHKTQQKNISHNSTSHSKNGSIKTPQIGSGLFQYSKLDQPTQVLHEVSTIKKFIKTIQQNKAEQPIKSRMKLDINHVQLFSSIPIKYRQIISELMKELINKVDKSYTAGLVNGNQASQKTVSFTNHENNIYDRIVSYPKLQTKENLTLMLGISCSVKNLLCNDLGMAMAIILRNDDRLPQKLRNQVYVCQISGHIACCIGHPEYTTCFVVDPWISFLNLPPKKGYRDELSKWDNPVRENGFMGSREDYKQFLRDHPNQYVPKGNWDLTIHTNFSNNTKNIQLEEFPLLLESYKMTNVPPNSPKSAKPSLKNQQELNKTASPLLKEFNFSNIQEFGDLNDPKLRIPDNQQIKSKIKFKNDCL